MGRAVENIIGRPLFDDGAGIHDVNAAAHLGDDAEIMGNEDDGHAQFRLEALEDIQDLGFCRHVEGRRRFVGKEEPRRTGQGHGDEAALAHAAR